MRSILGGRPLILTENDAEVFEPLKFLELQLALSWRVNLQRFTVAIVWLFELDGGTSESLI